VNSEELELSLRTEFESYLKDVVAEMRQGVTDFQTKINADFEKHKEELDKSLTELNERVAGERELEASFTETVTEHLKLARDEGASITASAIAEAEKLEEEAGLDFSDLRDAIYDISRKDSQSEILKALVNHASGFTSRGAFFIVKNEHLVGWRVFGREKHSDPKVVREVFFPVSTNTLLGDAVEHLATITSESEDSQDDVMYRNKLGYENPTEMYAIPLIARGRGVAVLYADSESEQSRVNISAIETLVRVAGLTVEVLASAPQVSRKKEAEAETEEVTEIVEEHKPEPTPAVEPEFAPITADAANDFTVSEPVEETVEDSEVDNSVVSDSPVSEFDSADSGYEEPAAFEAPSWEEPIAEPYTEEPTEDSYSDVESSDAYVPDVSFSSDFSEAEDTTASFDSYQAPVEGLGEEVEEAAPSYEFESNTEELPVTEDSETYSFESSEPYSVDEEIASPADAYSLEQPVEETAETYSFEQSVEAPVEDAPVDHAVSDYNEVAEFVSDESPVQFRDTPVETVEPEAVEEVEVEAPATPTVRSRFADRNLDLPIEVDENERRLHNDARRFARLLVSEIKLYNEQKVKEGRESSDLYERLREAIDRSREMYDKRVQPPVAARFDYFNYELVNALADGEEARLGGSYPGPTV
jgi:hypothetical protein